MLLDFYKQTRIVYCSMLRSIVLVTENVLMCQLKVRNEIVTQKQSYEF